MIAIQKGRRLRSKQHECNWLPRHSAHHALATHDIVARSTGHIDAYTGTAEMASALFVVSPLLSTLKRCQNIYVGAIAPSLHMLDIVGLSTSCRAAQRWTKIDGTFIVPHLGEDVPNDRPPLDLIVVARHIHLQSLRSVQIEPKDLPCAVTYLCACLHFLPLDEIALYGGFSCLKEKSEVVVEHFRTLFHAVAKGTSVKRLRLSLCHLGDIFCEPRGVEFDFSSLLELTLWNCSLTDGSLRGLANSLASRRGGLAILKISCPQTHTCPNQGVVSSQTAAALGDAVARMERLHTFELVGSSFVDDGTGNRFGQGVREAMRLGKMRKLLVDGARLLDVEMMTCEMSCCKNLHYLALADLSSVETILMVFRGASYCTSLKLLRVEDQGLGLPNQSTCLQISLAVSALIRRNQGLEDLTIPRMLLPSADVARHLLFAQILYRRPNIWYSDGGHDYDEALDFNVGDLIVEFAGSPWA